jgi:photosystem I subunit 3
MKHILNSCGSKNIIISSFVTFFLFANIKSTEAAYTNLTMCKDSPAFQKRLFSSLKKVEARKKLYSNQSKEYFALIKQSDSIKSRFNKYEKANLLCGKDGLPHLITSGQWDHASEFTLPGILFLYIAGWIGWSSRKYISYANSTENPFESEIIINVPIALSFMASGFAWPFSAIKELKTGLLLVSDKEITTSPR